MKKTSEELSSELENPKSAVRKWRFIEGEGDLDRDTLQAKRQWLEERLHQREEQLLEKELIAEEVTQLSEKLRAEAVESRQVGQFEIIFKTDSSSTTQRRGGGDV